MWPITIFLLDTKLFGLEFFEWVKIYLINVIELDRI